MQSEKLYNLKRTVYFNSLLFFSKNTKFCTITSSSVEIRLLRTLPVLHTKNITVKLAVL